MHRRARGPAPFSWCVPGRHLATLSPAPLWRVTGDHLCVSARPTGTAGRDGNGAGGAREQPRAGFGGVARQPFESSVVGAAAVEAGCVAASLACIYHHPLCAGRRGRRSSGLVSAASLVLGAPAFASSFRGAGTGVGGGAGEVRCMSPRARCPSVLSVRTRRRRSCGARCT
ncbi:hypothetical protein B0H11DRAFT_1204998 [Mycena galericulata]|nr:hypothetical protein B0H11DRAFT_1204998 [Mycena galericulata]